MTTSQILTITSLLMLAGCASNPPQVPLCLPDRPELETLTVNQQRMLHRASPESLALLSRNDTRLKAHLSTVESLVDAYNTELNLGSCELE